MTVTIHGYGIAAGEETRAVELDSERAQRAKLDGQARARFSTGEEWNALALKMLSEFAATRVTFTAEEFRFYMTGCGARQPASHKCWGALFTHAASRGLICKTGRYKAAQSIKTHGHPVMVWRRG